jgi:hypothetical protein
MNGAHAPAAPSAVVERYVARIEDHLVRLAAGHDPMGHLFAIERLARVARAEWWEAQRRPGRERRGP